MKIYEWVSEVGDFSESNSPEKKTKSRTKRKTVEGRVFKVEFQNPTEEPDIRVAQVLSRFFYKLFLGLTRFICQR